MKLARNEILIFIGAYRTKQLQPQVYNLQKHTVYNSDRKTNGDDICD